MTPRELRLRERIDQLADERDAAQAERDAAEARARDLARRLVAQRNRNPYRRCCYCGTPCYGQACHLHRDLLHLEQAPLLRTTTAARTNPPGRNGAGGKEVQV